MIGTNIAQEKLSKLILIILDILRKTLKTFNIKNKYGPKKWKMFINFVNNNDRIGSAMRMRIWRCAYPFGWIPLRFVNTHPGYGFNIEKSRDPRRGSIGSEDDFSTSRRTGRLTYGVKGWFAWADVRLNFWGS